MNSIFKLSTIVTSLFFLVLISPVTGELFRVSVFGLDFLPTDLLLMALFLTWFIDKVKNDHVLRLGKIGKAVIFFLFMMVITFLLNAFRFELSEMKSAFMYLARLGLYFMLMPITYDCLSRYKKLTSERVAYFLTIPFLILILLGFLQLKYFPSFLELGLHLNGWDPHIGRLLSTWFDPNFIAGFIAFLSPLFLSLSLYFYSKRNKALSFLFFSIFFIGLIGLYLTFSRSGYLAFMASIFVLALFKTRKILIWGVLSALLVFSFSGRVQNRTLEAVDSAKALIGIDSQKPLDPTAELRVWSWKFAIEIIRDYPLIGAGYNRYPFEINQRGHGLLSDHSSGGSDSSLLTIWATGGLITLITFLMIPLVAVLKSAPLLIGKATLGSYLRAGWLAGFSGLMIHSFFVNSLLFSFMLIYMMVGLTLLDH